MGYIGSVVTQARGPQASRAKALLSPMCARVSCVTTDLLHSLLHSFPCTHHSFYRTTSLQLLVVGCGMHQTHEKRFLPTTESVNSVTQRRIQGEIQGSKGTPLLLKILKLIFSNLQSFTVMFYLFYLCSNVNQQADPGGDPREQRNPLLRKSELCNN